MHELGIWKAYREKYGSLFVGRRIEQAVGYALYRYFCANPRYPEDCTPVDFMPNEMKGVAKAEFTLEDYMESLCGE